MASLRMKTAVLPVGMVSPLRKHSHMFTSIHCVDAWSRNSSSQSLFAKYYICIISCVRLSFIRGGGVPVSSPRCPIVIFIYLEKHHLHHFGLQFPACECKLIWYWYLLLKLCTKSFGNVMTPAFVHALQHIAIQRCPASLAENGDDIPRDELMFVLWHISHKRNILFGMVSADFAPESRCWMTGNLIHRIANWMRCR